MCKKQESERLTMWLEKEEMGVESSPRLRTKPSGLKAGDGGDHSIKKIKTKIFSNPSCFHIMSSCYLVICKLKKCCNWIGAR